MIYASALALGGSLVLAPSVPAPTAYALNLMPSPQRSTGAPATADTRPDSASLTFGLLKSLTAKPDQADWQARIHAAGLRPWPGHEGWWHLNAPDGELRAQAVFRDTETTVFLLFFPAKSTPLPDATLTWMYRTAAGYAFDNADDVELSFAEEALSGGSGRRQQFFKLSLTSGTLTRTAVTMRWK